MIFNNMYYKRKVCFYNTSEKNKLEPYYRFEERLDLWEQSTADTTNHLKHLKQEENVVFICN